MTVRRLSLTGPLTVVPAGGVARLEVGPFDRSFDFALSRYGDPTPVRRGERIGGAFRVRVPAGRAHRGVPRARARRRPPGGVAAGRGGPAPPAGRRPAAAAARAARAHVAGRERGGRRRRRLRGHPPARPGSGWTARSPAAGRPGFAGEVAPLLRFLDRARLAYDLTTDLSLARREGPALGNAPGVAFAGSPVWLPAELGARLREYVTAAARWRRSARAGSAAPSGWARTALRRASAPAPRTSSASARPRPHRRARRSTCSPTTRASSRACPLIGDFTCSSARRRSPPAPRSSVAAGREVEEPAFVLYRLGDGLVLRSGTPEWAGRLDESAAERGGPARDEPRLGPRCPAVNRPRLSPANLRRDEPTPQAAGRRRPRRGALAAAAGVYAYNESQPTEKRGSADEEFVTDAAPEPAPPPKTREPAPVADLRLRRGRTHIAPYDHRPPGRRLWSINAHDTIEFPPAVGYGRVYLAQQKGLFFALDAKTGRVDWKKSLAPLRRRVADDRADGVVYQSYMHDVPASRAARARTASSWPGT